MQVISRRVNEGVIIGEKTHVTVLKIYEDHVRLAISSPQHVPSFWEQDVYVKQQDEKRQWWKTTFRGLPRFEGLR